MNVSLNGIKSPSGVQQRPAAASTAQPYSSPLPGISNQTATTSTTTITHSSSLNSTTFMVCSPTKKQSIISIAKKSTSPSKFFNNSSLYGVRVNISSSNLNINLSNRLNDATGGRLSGDSQTSSSLTMLTSTTEEENGGQRIRKSAMTKGSGEPESGNDREKLKRRSLMDH